MLNRWGPLSKGERVGSLAEQFEVAISGDAGCPEVVPDDEYRHSGILWNHHRRDYARFGQHHVVARGADTTKPIRFKNFDELAYRRWA